MIVWLEGFDVIKPSGIPASTDFPRYNSAIPTTGTIETGRRQGKSFAGKANVASSWRTPSLGSDEWWIIGIAARLTRAGDTPIIRFVDGGVGVQLDLDMLAPASGEGYTTLRVRRGSTVLESYILEDNDWVYIEMKARIHTSLGQYEVRINGEEVMSASGLNTANTGVSGAEKMGFGCGFRSGLPVGESKIDDIYIVKGNESFLGNSVVQETLPSLDGEIMEGSLIGGNTATECLDDPTGATDGDSTRMELVVDSKIALFDFNLQDFLGDVLAVEVAPVIQPTTANNVGHDVYIKRGASVAQVGHVSVPHSQPYKEFPHLMETDPITTSPWIFSGVGGAQFGVRKTGP